MEDLVRTGLEGRGQAELALAGAAGQQVGGERGGGGVIVAARQRQLPARRVRRVTVLRVTQAGVEYTRANLQNVALISNPRRSS